MQAGEHETSALRGGWLAHGGVEGEVVDVGRRCSLIDPLLRDPRQGGQRRRFHVAAEHDRPWRGRCIDRDKPLAKGLAFGEGGIDQRSDAAAQRAAPARVPSCHLAEGSVTVGGD